MDFGSVNESQYEVKEVSKKRRNPPLKTLIPALYSEKAGAYIKA